MDRISDAAVIGGWRAHLAGLEGDVSDAERIEPIRELEQLKAGRRRRRR